MLFVGKLDGWENMKSGVPTGLPCVFHSLAPENNFENWADIVAKTEPVEGRPTREMDELAVIAHSACLVKEMSRSLERYPLEISDEASMRKRSDSPK